MADMWNDDQPIYRQLYERVIRLILQREFAEGDALPSVRQLSADYQINHLTVAKSYQLLVDEGLVEKRRGLGMFVLAGAREHLLARERKRFLEQELPEVAARAHRLGIDAGALQRALAIYLQEGEA